MSVAHFAMSIPNGAMNMIMMPSIIERASFRHALEERVHVFDVTRADVVLCGAHAQEEQALRDSVEDNEEDRSPDRLCGTNARTSRDEAKVRDGRISKHALGIHLRDGKERATGT